MRDLEGHSTSEETMRHAAILIIAVVMALSASLAQAASAAGYHISKTVPLG
jgi:hypothetical protein